MENDIRQAYDEERQRMAQALREKRAKRGDSDPLNRLRAYIARQIASGIEPIVEQTNKDSEQ